MKEIYDNIHGYIKLDNSAIKIIDSSIFKRLKNLKQLGNCHYVFPGAQHTRFEHSIGVYFLAGKILEEIKKNQPEINVNEKTIELVKIAGLVHDLGHGPFSHLYDNIVINSLIENGIHIYEKNRIHEYRSCLLFEEIVKESKIKYNKDEILFIKSLICPKYFNRINKYPKFLYQIISNEDTSLDVDKFDYLKRDPYNIGLNKHIDFERLIQNIRIIDNEIYYPKKIINQVHEIFEIRFKFFRDIYNHHTVVSIDYMISDILTNILIYLKKYKNFDINSLNNFINIDDNIIDNILNFNYLDNELIKKSIKLYNRIKNRNLYKLVETINENEISSKLISIKKRRNPNLIFNKVNLNSMKKYLDNVNYYNSNNNFLDVESNQLNIIQVFDKS